MNDVSGVSGAAPVLRDVMDWLHSGDPATSRPCQPSRAPAAPASVVWAKLRFDPPRKPPRRERFVAGTETDIVRAAAHRGLARISYPADGR